MNGAIHREQSLKGVVTECMRVGTFGGKNHEVRHVDDADAKGWDQLAKESGGCDDFKGDLDANTDQDANEEEESKQVSGGFPIVDLHIRVFAVVHAGEFPNGSTGYTMLLAN